MKKAYQYIRISDEDQSNFSLSGQQKMNTDFAAKHGIEIVKCFVDDGYSAKNFDRPDWQELEKTMSKNKNQIDYLIITKYDRLIRNAAEGLAFIERLEQKWNIKLLSVMENFFIDPHSPYFFKMRADLLVNAEFERRVISDRTKFGNWSAKTQGRFIGPAPFGYDNSRDEQDMPILIVNEKEKEMVEQVYMDFLSDVPFPVILHKMRDRGFHLKGHDALTRMLSNHVYGGFIKVPSYKDEQSTVKKGIHQAIIPEDVFWKAYYKLQDKIRPQGPKIIDDNVPLRGFLLCQSCGGFHTGGKSKGRSSFYYYYRCKKCRGENYSSVKVHKEMSEILKYLSLDEKYISKLKKENEIQLEESLKSRNDKLKRINSEYASINDKLSSLEEKYIANKIAQSSYEKWYPVYSRELNEKKGQMADLNKNDNETLKRYETYLPYLTDLNLIYNKGNVEGKQSFLKGIFLGGFTKEKIGGRTGMVNPMFYQNSLNISTLLRVSKREKPEFSSGFPYCTQEGTRTPTPCGTCTSNMLVYHSNTWANYLRKQKYKLLGKSYL
jgi:site-specific DNA recombinase